MQKRDGDWYLEIRGSWQIRTDNLDISDRSVGDASHVSMLLGVLHFFFPSRQVLNPSPQDCAISKYPFNCMS